MLKLILILGLLFLTACQTAPVDDQDDLEPMRIDSPRRGVKKRRAKKLPPKEQYRRDYNRRLKDLRIMQKDFDLDLPKDKLGIFSRKMKKCKGIKKPCTATYFNLIQFQMYCRDSSGTVEYVSADDYRPVKDAEMVWKSLGKAGVIETDRRGRGQILMLSTSPIKYKKLILIKGENSLQLRFNQVSKIVVPNDWCY